MVARRSWFVLAGGGTGGHLYPGLVVAETLRALQPGLDVSVFGTSRPIDRKLVGPRGFELVEQEVKSWPRRPWQIPRFLWAWHRSVRRVRRRFKERRPALVLGLGGYSAAPAVVEAARMGVPTALFNPDAGPGRANRKLAGRVDLIFTQWRETAEDFDRSPKVRCTGCPIRPEFARVKRQEAIRALKLDPDKKTLLITGASQGAWSINAAVTQLLDLWQMAIDWQLIHLTGNADFEGCRQQYREAGVNALTAAFTEHMPACMAAADLVISRAGASTLAEIMAMGVPSILMPYPFDRARHQLANARILAENHAAVIVDDANDADANAKALRGVLENLMNSDHRRCRMAEAASAMGRHDAALAIAEALLELVTEA